ncbi:MAG TPA: NnrS family protein [Burkholderiales bacterium]|nr:NnrS family protein [Burkholderiales bacterium]
MLVSVDPPSPPVDPARFALFDLGFRPFYLLAGAYAALAVPLWAAEYAGWLPGPGILWHAHEMIFGYAFAVIAGFLLTAVRAWTGRPTPVGAPLAALAALWLAGRALAFVSLPAAAWAGVAFAVALAASLARPLLAAGNRRNLFFVGLVLGLGAAGVLAQGRPQLGLALGLDVVMLVMAVVAGRVIPAFTNNAVPAAGARRLVWLERAALAALVLLLAADALERVELAAGLAVLAALLHAARLALWAPLRTLGKPILWILHLSYGWIVVHLALRGLAGFDVIPFSLATHALTVGAIGGLTLGMMTRTARGHTARPLAAGRAELAAYLLVQLAAVTRVLVPLAFPAFYLGATLVAAASWFLAFAVFVAAYVPILARPRLDGRPG